MTEKYVISSAKTAKDLDDAFKKAKAAFKDYGFDKTTELKADVVKKAMTDGKKGADFIAEYDWVKNAYIGQLVCDVKGKMRSVIGRTEIKDEHDFVKFKGIASNAAMKKQFAELHH